MKLIKKLITLLLIASMIFSIVSCEDKPSDNDQDEIDNSDTDNNNTEQEDKPAVMADYTVTVLTPDGAPLSGVSIFVHEDGGADYNVCTTPKATDENGKAVFNLDSAKIYSVGLIGVPQMYLNKSGKTRADRYILDTTDTTITLKRNENYVPAMYKLGDKMLDFTVTDIDGNTYTLYDLLEEKKAVVINFWFCGCGPCRMEFPSLNAAYNEYKDEIEVLAINDHPNESLSDVRSYESDTGLNLDIPLIRGSYGSRISLSRFDSEGYPTTIVIDRYGNVAFLHVGAVTSTSYWRDLFDFFTADDYTPTVYE